MTGRKLVITWALMKLAVSVLSYRRRRSSEASAGSLPGHTAERFNDRRKTLAAELWYGRKRDGGLDGEDATSRDRPMGCTAIGTMGPHVRALEPFSDVRQVCAQCAWRTHVGSCWRHHGFCTLD